MTPLPSFFLVLLLLQTSLGNKDFKKYVHKDLHHCCQEKVISGCSDIDAVFSQSLASKREMFAFYKNLFIRTSFDEHFIPQDTQVHELFSEWKGFPKDPQNPVQAAFLLDDTFIIKRGNKYWTYKQLPSGPLEPIEPLGVDMSPHPIFKKAVPGKKLLFVGSFARSDPFIGPHKSSPWVVGYFGDKATNIYTLIGYKGKPPNSEAQPEYLKTNVYLPEKPTSITGTNMYFKNSKTSEYAVTFNRFGFMCPHKRDFADETNFSFAKHASKYMFECFPSNLLLGCPQSFCFRTDMDSMMLTSTGHFSITSGRYEWLIPATDDNQLPLDMPRVTDAKRSTYQPPKYSTDAAASVAALMDGELFREHLFRGDQVIVNIYPVTGSKKTERHSLRTYFSRGPALVDAAFYEYRLDYKVQDVIYLFKGGAYYTFEPQMDAGKSQVLNWKLFLVGDIKRDLLGLPRDLDAAVVMGLKHLYFFKDQMVYSSLVAEMTDAYYRPRPVAENFFNVKAACGYSEKQMENMRKRLEPFVPPKAGDEPDPTPLPPTAPPTTQGSTVSTVATELSTRLTSGTPITTSPFSGTDRGSDGGNDGQSTQKKEDSSKLIAILIMAGVALVLILIIGFSVFIFTRSSSKRKKEKDPFASKDATKWSSDRHSLRSDLTAVSSSSPSEASASSSRPEPKLSSRFETIHTVSSA